MPPRLILPYWHTKDRSHTLYAGNALTVLKGLPSNSVHCVCTSPPFYGLRDHKAGPDELGREETPQQYTDKLVVIFREIKRILHSTGVLFINLGDTYSGGGGGNYTKGTRNNSNENVTNVRNRKEFMEASGLPAGNLIGIPWRVAFALQEDGWLLRSDLPWLKRNAMPESGDSRPNKSLEYFFMLTKSMRYYFDLQAVRKSTRNFRNSDLWYESVSPENAAKSAYGLVGVGDELVGLDVTLKSYKGAHYSVYPVDLIRPLLTASTSEKGCCPECLMPWTRVVEKERVATRPAKESKVFANGERLSQEVTGNRDPLRHVTVTHTLGWEPGCTCIKASDESASSSGEAYAPVPCTILDPFLGSGTTSLCSISLGRHSVGIDLKEEYLAQQAVPRLSKALLEAGQSHLLLAEE